MFWMGDHLRLGIAIRLLCIPTLYMYMEDMTVATVRFVILPLSPKSILAFYASDSHTAFFNTIQNRIYTNSISTQADGI